MSTLKTVGNKLFAKTELASHKVELATIKELQSATAKVTKDLAAGQKYQDQLDKLKSEASALAKKFNEFSSNAKSGMPLSANLWALTREIETAAKELGLDASNSTEVVNAKNIMTLWEEWKTDVAKMATESAEYAKRF
jgi:hypothetical protein